MGFANIIMNNRTNLLNNYPDKKEKEPSYLDKCPEGDYLKNTRSFNPSINPIFLLILIERHGDDGPSRHFSELCPNRAKWTGATNVPGDVGDADDFANRRIGAHNVCYPIHNNLRDSRHTPLGRY